VAVSVPMFRLRDVEPECIANCCGSDMGTSKMITPAWK